MIKSAKHIHAFNVINKEDHDRTVKKREIIDTWTRIFLIISQLSRREEVSNVVQICNAEKLQDSTMLHKDTFASTKRDSFIHCKYGISSAGLSVPEIKGGRDSLKNRMQEYSKEQQVGRISAFASANPIVCFYIIASLPSEDSKGVLQGGEWILQRS